MRGLGMDFRLALRALRKSPAFAAIVVLTIALGSGANTAIFTLLDQVMLRMLPVEGPDRLVVLNAPGPFSGWTNRNSDLIPLSHPMYLGLRDRTAAFAGVLAHFPTPIHLSAGGDTDNVTGDMVSGTFFEVLGVRPALGRLFGPGDDRVPSGHPVVVLGHRFFERRFGGDPGIVGRAVSVNNHPMTVVGVAPPGFDGIEVGSSVDVYVPLAMQLEVQPTWGQQLGEWRSRWLICVARLRDGVGRAEAAASANLVYRQLLQEDLGHVIQSWSESRRTGFLEKSLELLPGGRGTSGLRDDSGTPLVVLMGMVGLVLLIACANVASLLLTRASSRRKEIAVRLALGAGRLRLVRQHLVESVTLSMAGGLVGLLLAYWVGEALVRALPYEDAARTLSAAPDLRVGLFTLSLSMLTGVAAGLVPALRSSRSELATAVKREAAAVVGGGGHFRLRKGLVVAQVALSLLLLIGAGLFTRSLMNLRALDPGFRTESLFAFTVDPSLNGYDFARRVDVLRRIQEELAAEPGVTDASAAEVALMTNSDASSTVRVEGYQPKEGEDMNPYFNSVAPGFFATLGIPIVAGRDVQPTDVLGAPRVAVVNESFARYFFKNASPIGRRFGSGRREEGYAFEIVGVVRDGKSAKLREETHRFVYVPFMQEETVPGLTFYARSAAHPDLVGPRLRAVVKKVDPTLPVTGLKTMTAQVGESLFVERMVAALSAAFGLLAALLAAIGLYGVTSSAVTARTREIGLRVALGADRRSVLLMVLRDVALLAGIGVAIGLPGGYGLGRIVESQLYGLTGRDPLTFTVATAALLVTAILAGLLPAARAARVDPMTALRYE